jgi:hypothetical protein
VPAQTTMAPFTYEVSYTFVNASGATLAACRTAIRAAIASTKAADTNTDNCRLEVIFYQNKNLTYGANAHWYEMRHSADQTSRW